MTGEIVSLLGDAAAFGGALGYLNVIPPAVKDRLLVGYTYLVGRIKRKVYVHDRREDAEIADEEKRVGNKTIAEQKVLETLVPDIAKKIAGDPELMERAVIGVMGEAYRKQENKEAVVEECLKDIEDKQEDVSSDPAALDEDWLNIFSSHAEKASTERTRQLWGRILSGEVRKPGKFSIKTLRLLSEIDKETAEIFVEKCSLLLDSSRVIISTDDINSDFNRWKSLEEAGLVYGVESRISVASEKKEDKSICIFGINLLIEATPANGMEPDVSCISLTKTGNELIDIIEYKENFSEKCRLIRNIFERDIFFKKYSIKKIHIEKADPKKGIPLELIYAWEAK